jgi:hypothetical protein
MKKATVFLAIVSAILATGLAMSVLGTTPVYAQQCAAAASSVSGTAAAAAAANQDTCAAIGLALPPMR